MAELQGSDSQGAPSKPRLWPVLDGLESAGLSGRDVAMVAGVSPPTVSKWRSGRIHVPGPKLAFLTLVLAHLLDDLRTMLNLEAEWGTLSPNWSARTDPRGEAALRALEIQEGLNMALPAIEVRKGAQLFRAWWASGAATDLQAVVFEAFKTPLKTDNHEPNNEPAQEPVAKKDVA